MSIIFQLVSYTSLRIVVLVFHKRGEIFMFYLLIDFIFNWYLTPILYDEKYFVLVYANIFNIDIKSFVLKNIYWYCLFVFTPLSMSDKKGEKNLGLYMHVLLSVCARARAHTHTYLVFIGILSLHCIFSLFLSYA